MNVQIYSRKEIETIITGGRFPENTAVISFCDSGTEPRERVNYSSVCSRIMYIELDDLELDELSGAGYSYDTFFPEADETAEFIIDAYNSGMNIICQCEYGQSRSAGCAAAIMEHFRHGGLSFFADHQYYPNKVVYHKVLDALNHRGGRVELHLHTNMSLMAGASSVEELITCAVEIGQKAIAITDNGVVQAFPEAYRIVAEHSEPIKIIYGMEGNLGDCLPSEPATLTILAKNQEGLRNLYKLVSWSHLENLIEGKAHITKAKLSELRSGLLVGSSSETGELYRAVSSGKTQSELVEIARFYDYLEICHSMPQENVLKIIRLGTQLDIPVCAAGNVYFSCENEIEYHILLGDEPRYVDSEIRTELSLWATEEMLWVFKYLGEEKAYEVVVTNTNLIANMIGDLNIIPEKIPMVIMNCAGALYKDDTTICAGTIETMSESDAEAHIREYVKKYDLDWDNDRIKFFSGEIAGAKKGVNKQCGTYIVFPNGYSAEDITPLQYADNGKDVVSHLDFSCLQDVIEQVSFPAVDYDSLRKLEKLTGKKAVDIPIDDPAVYSLFTSSDALGLIDDGHDSFLRGTLSIANLSNDTFEDIIFLCKPKNFEEVVKVCGLYYSVGGWFCNVRNLIYGGAAKLNEVISVRDDIVEYLVSKGVEPAAAIDIMKKTSFGEAKTKLLPEHIRIMREHNVPEWYIESLKKFRFLFPKSVIAEYAKYIVELAWCKLYHPREYYKVYFESKQELLDKKALDIICGGADVIYKKTCELGETMEIWENESELMLLFETAYEAICRGVDLTGII